MSDSVRRALWERFLEREAAVCAGRFGKGASSEKLPARGVSFSMLGKIFVGRGPLGHRGRGVFWSFA